MAETLVLTTADGLTLEAELARPEGARAGVVLCHPHPLYGGTMRSVVIGELFRHLPAARIAALRFNFRGVEGSEGRFGEGFGEQLDARAALEHLVDALPVSTPVVMAGWSFGADVALSVREGEHVGWLAVAPPLRFVPDAGATGADPRPKCVVLAQHDQFRSPAEVEEALGSWAHTTVTVVPGADHFFIGRTDRVAALATEFVDTVLANR